MEKMAFTVTEFCKAYGVSRGRFHELQQVGLAPKVYYIASKPYVSRKAADEWMVRMENGEGATFERAPAKTPGVPGRSRAKGC